MPGRHLNVAGQNPVEEIVEPAGDIPVKPAVTAGRAFFHGNAEHHRHPAFSLRQLGPPHQAALTPDHTVRRSLSPPTIVGRPLRRVWLIHGHRSLLLSHGINGNNDVQGVAAIDQDDIMMARHDRPVMSTLGKHSR